ncbi:MAG TPA: TetR/AcrR family transcriptional regulator [Gaiellaceae bacterium]|nr:TetR/AcrR family transcriptional regulator [Gaiellaceae bacterium]
MLRTAVRLADENGLESLSMRKLGQELGVQAMSLYNHVASKDDLRDGILDLVKQEIELPPAGADWKAAIRASAISAHDVLVRHPWAAGLINSTRTVSSARLGWMEAILRTLREAGCSANLTHHAYHALDSHITGFTLWQVSFRWEELGDLEELAASFLRTLPVEKYPYLAEHVREHLVEPDPEEKTEFEFGLDLILDGVERIRDAAASAA